MDAPTLDAARALLREHFGYPDFRPGQDEIVASVLERRDTVVIMPTGGGKSLCYQIPALLFDGLTIVVSPLISLMKDQVDALQQARVRATFINSMLDYHEMTDRIDKARYGYLKLMYVAPERFESAAFIERMKGVRVSLFAIDEAHCISEWGHDFRPSYMKLREARALLGDPQVVALTATATPDVRADIQKQLGLQDPRIIVRGFKRDNLSFRVTQGGNKRDHILTACASGDCGIVYAGTRNAVEEIAQFLRHHSISVEAYHAGLEEQQRKRVQEAFMGGAVNVIVATTAFGMGIDKSNVRFVIHHDMPGTIEQYYQEAGRAGRDGGPSVCTILYSSGDRALPEYFIRQMFPDKSTVQDVYAHLHNYAGNQLGSETRMLLNLTAKTIASQLGRPSESAVRSSLDLLEKHAYVRRISSSYDRSTVQFILPPEDLREWLLNPVEPTLAPVIVALMRTAGSEAFYHPVDVFIGEIAEKTFLSEDHLLAGLHRLHDDRMIEFHAGQRASGIALLGARVHARDLQIDYRILQRRMQHQMEKLQAMERYILGKACRRNMILEYFEETDIRGVCGTCDTCTSTRIDHCVDDDDFERYRDMILACVAELGGKFGRTTIADVLRGAKTKRIAQFTLYEATTYGKAGRTDKNTLLSAIDAMTGLGWLEKTDSLHPSVHLTKLGREKLGRPVPALALPRPSDSAEAAVKDRVLFEALLAVRRRVAAELNVPSHTLVPQSVMIALANAAPRDEDQLLAVEGLGPTIVKKCGKQFLRAIEDHLRQLALGSAMQRSHESIAELPASLQQTFALCLQGLALAEVASRRGLTDGTVSQHVAELVDRGVRFDLDPLVPPDHQRQIRKAMQVVKKPELKKIKALIDADISYAEIRIMLSWVARENALK